MDWLMEKKGKWRRPRRASKCVILVSARSNNNTGVQQKAARVNDDVTHPR